MDKVKIVVFVPEAHTDAVRKAIGKAGGGVIGKYSHCSFSIKGVGRFKPLKGAKPAIGKVGQFESAKEERIEFVCLKSKIKRVLKAINKAHPYEEPATDIYPLLELDS